MSDSVEIRLVHAWDEKEIASLYRSGGWWKEEYAADELRYLIRGSFLFAVAVDTSTGRAVGMGRAISDGVSDAYIQDVVVHKAYQKGGVGRKIISALVTRCRESGLTWIGLIAQPGTGEFYTPLGFEVMEGHVPMLHRGDDRC
jgi:GNAT superfamily N-acetyltransferase